MLGDVFRGSEAVAAGLVTPDQLRGPRFRRVFPDVYAPASLTFDLTTRSRAAFLLVRDRGGALGGYSAALLQGADCAPLNIPAEVILPGSARPHAGLRLRREALTVPDLAVASGLLMTTPQRTAWDLARRLSLVDAVVAVDALARANGFQPADLLTRRQLEPGARGCRRLDRVVALADPRAESPPETRLRVGLVLAGHGWLTVRLFQENLKGMPQTVGQIRAILTERLRARPDLPGRGSIMPATPLR